MQIAVKEEREENMDKTATVTESKIQRMELLYEKFYNRLYLYAHTFLFDADEAKDVVGDVFQMIWEDWSHEDSRYEDPTVSFLYVTIRNRCLDRLRHTKASDNYVSEFMNAGLLVNDEEVADFEERVLLLRKAVDRLPEPGRTILLHVYFKRLTYHQTSEMLGVSENMIHKHMVKMLKLLRKMLNY